MFQSFVFPTNRQGRQLVVTEEIIEPALATQVCAALVGSPGAPSWGAGLDLCASPPPLAVPFFLTPSPLCAP